MDDPTDTSTSDEVADTAAEYLRDFTDSLSGLTLQLPQRHATFALIGDIIISPYVFVQFKFVLIWIMTMTFVAMLWLLSALLLLRIELFEKTINRAFKSFYQYIIKDQAGWHRFTYVRWVANISRKSTIEDDYEYHSGKK
jgi:hypothetical protein